MHYDQAEAKQKIEQILKFKGDENFKVEQEIW
jgi:hypothetical protein